MIRIKNHYIIYILFFLLLIYLLIINSLNESGENTKKSKADDLRRTSISKIQRNYTKVSDFNSTSNKTIVFYAYFEKNSLYVDTIKFFIQFGLTECDQIDYVFVIQGEKLSIDIPSYKNVRILRRSNDCYDFGAYGKAIDWIGGPDAIKKYKAFLFINPSAIGPILPKYWPKEIHWTKIFTNRLNRQVHAVGTSIVCLYEPNLGGIGPRIEGYAFAASSYAVNLAWVNGVFNCHQNKKDAIIEGEYGFSKLLLDNGLNIDSLLLKYGEIDWRNMKNWKCNNNVHPTRRGSYDDGLSVHPLEVVFHKPIWDLGSNNLLPSVYKKEILMYMKWARSRNFFTKSYYEGNL